MKTSLRAAVVAGICWFGFQSGAFADNGLVTDLYQYYPQKTMVYFELNYNQLWLERVFRLVDSMAGLSSKEQRPVDEEFVRTATALYNAHFEDHMTMGTWREVEKTLPQSKPAAKKPVAKNAKAKTPAKPAVADKPEKPKVHYAVLGTATLKPGVDAESLEKMLSSMTEKSHKTPYHIIREGNLTLLKNDDKHAPILAIDQNHLLIADSTITIKDALKVHESGDNILKNGELAQYLPNFSETRQGTLLFSNQDIMHDFKFNYLGVRATGSSTLKDQYTKVQQFYDQFLKAFPVCLVAITLSDDGLIRGDSLTPVDWTQVRDEAFAKDLEKMLGKSTSINSLAKSLPSDTIVVFATPVIANYYDLVYNYMLTDSIKNGITTHTSFLSDLSLDLRTNIIGLFDDQFAAAISGRKVPGFWVFMNKNADTQQTIDKGLALASMSAKNVTINDEAINGVGPTKTLNIKGLPFPVSLSSIEPGKYVLATPANLQSTGNALTAKEQSLADEPQFHNLTSSLPDATMSFSYINMPQLIETISRLTTSGSTAAKAAQVVGEKMDADATKATGVPASETFKRMLSAWEGVVVNAYMGEENLIKGQFLLKLTERPESLKR